LQYVIQTIQTTKLTKKKFPCKLKKYNLFAILWQNQGSE